MPSSLDACRLSEVPCDDAHWNAISKRLSTDPKDPDALFACAAYLASWHKMTEAVELLEELTEVSPKYPGLWRFKARLFKEMGRTKEASECREKGEVDL